MPRERGITLEVSIGPKSELAIKERLIRADEINADGVTALVTLLTSANIFPYLQTAKKQATLFHTAENRPSQLAQQILNLDNSIADRLAAAEALESQLTLSSRSCSPPVVLDLPKTAPSP